MKLKFIFKKDRPIPTDDLRSRISEGGLKATRQREEIFQIFRRSPGHKSLAQVYALVSKANPKIGHTTVYRTLKLLTRLGLAEERKFADRETRYEPTSGGKHHDHLVCTRCGRILEFEDDGLEDLQKRIAEGYRFQVFHHRMELYGLCAECHPERNRSTRKG